MAKKPGISPITVDRPKNNVVSPVMSSVAKRTTEAVTKIAWAIGLSLVCLLSCSDQSAPTNEAALDKSKNESTRTRADDYIELGDLDAIRQHGKLRLIAPRFDGADALPRQGMLVQDYQGIAEEFSNSLGLDAEWHFVDGFEQLIPMLENGAGDIIVTNLSNTEERRNRIAFTAAINRVNEVIVSHKDRKLSSLERASTIQITVPEGTAYLETLKHHNANNDTLLSYNVVASDTSDADLLDGIVSGQYQATVMDSNVANQLLIDYPDLATGAVLQRNREVGWAVRQNAQQLLDVLNRYLVAHFLTSATYENQARDWQAIKDHGRIRMLTTNNPASYFMWRGDLMGFDYDLASKFAEQHSLHLEVVIKNSIPDLIQSLINGEGDFIAASLTQSAEREAKGLVFSQPYLRLSEQLVGLRDGPAIETLQDLSGKTVGVNPDTVFYQRLNTWRDTGIDLEILKYPGVSTEELFSLLVDGEFQTMLADSHLVSMEKVYRDNINILLDLESNSHIAWALRPQQMELLSKLNDFIGKEYRGLFYNVTFNKYFVNERKIRSLQANRVRGDSGLSPYDDTVKAVADKFGMDWRLLTAQMFQESRFDPQAKSFAGAVGLMQVMPRTAKEFGYTNLADPAQGVEAGVAYLNWLADRFPGDIDFQERIYFQLAAYNAGAGHVRDARRLARQLNLDSDRWFNNVEKAMLLLAKPDYYKKARFGYVRGSEPVTYVREIRDRYLAYLNLEN